MISIGHIYAYYKADEAMLEALRDNKIDLSPATDNYSVLSKYLSAEEPCRTMTNAIAEAMLKNPVLEDMSEKAQTISALYEIKQILSPFD